MGTGTFGDEIYSPASVWAFLVARTVENLPTVQETWVQSLGRKDPLETEMATHFSILPGGFHGWKNLTVYSPWGRKESDTTERLTHY